MHELTGRTHWHEPTGNDRAGFGAFGRPKTPYDLFMESEGIPIYRDIGVSKVQNLPLAPWKRLGGKGTYIQLHGTEGKWGSYVVEVPGADALKAEKHLYEEIYLVVEGRGTTEVSLDNRRSPGWRRVEPFMTGNTFYLWIGQHENGRYSKAHAHTSAAVLICLKGKGYTYTWPERCGISPWKDGHADKVRRVDYEPVGMVSAAPGGARWYHQHFGASKEPLRLTAWFGPHNPGREPGPPGEKHTDYTAMDITEGGSSIPYWMEDPFISAEYEAKLKAEGVPSRMDPEFYKKGAVVPKFAGA